MDRVEVPPEVCMPRGSVEGGPAGPGKAPNGQEVSPGLTGSPCAVTSHIGGSTTWGGTKAQAGGGHAHQPSDAQTGFLKVAGDKQ